MTKRISRVYLNSLLLKVNIVNIIGSKLTLEKKSYGFLSICPFHNEKTPSFFVNENKQKYYCFGCHSSGDVIQFLMSYKNISFFETVNILSKMANIEFKELSVNLTTYNLIESVSQAYSKNLNDMYNSKNYISSYLRQRDIDFNLIKKFKLGFARNLWSFVLKNFGASSDSREKLISIGLLICKNKRVYDRFRDRLIFPIRDLRGNVLGFGARSLDNNIKPKYINSSESYIFSKRKELYGLYESRVLNKNQYDYVIVVEGYTDAIMLHKYGITSVVATLGTALQKSILKV